MGCSSPCGLLPGWGRWWLLCPGQCGQCQGWVFPVSCFYCAIPSQRFTVGISTLALLLCHSWPPHLPQPRWEVLGCHSQPRGGSNPWVWQLGASEADLLQERLCSCCRALPWPLCVPACSSPTAPQVLWLTELCSLGCAVSCVSLLSLPCSCSYKVHWECWCFFCVLSV